MISADSRILGEASIPRNCENGTTALQEHREVEGHRGRACPVCLVRHDQEIHAATLSVRLWFRSRVMRNFADEPPSEDGGITS